MLATTKIGPLNSTEGSALFMWARHRVHTGPSIGTSRKRSLMPVIRSSTPLARGGPFVITRRQWHRVGVSGSLAPTGAIPSQPQTKRQASLGLRVLSQFTANIALIRCVCVCACVGCIRECFWKSVKVPEGSYRNQAMLVCDHRSEVIWPFLLGVSRW